VAGHIARWLRDEEAAGSNPATPTSSKGIAVRCSQLVAGAE
jgi:hypothetical protein